MGFDAALRRVSCPTEDRMTTTHKFAVGQAVRYSPNRALERTTGGSFKIVRLLPEADSMLQYQVKSQTDGHERVVREDQLARS
jgi:hypothetical protein